MQLPVPIWKWVNPLMYDAWKWWEAHQKITANATSFFKCVWPFCDVIYEKNSKICKTCLRLNQCKDFFVFFRIFQNLSTLYWGFGADEEFDLSSLFYYTSFTYAVSEAAL